MCIRDRPQFCLRVSNNFGVLQKRFAKELGKEVVLLTITFDPQRDTPEVLAEYASQWKADPKTWHFLTGPVADVRKVCALFGVEYFPDEGLMNHSLRTAVIDRGGTLVASIEGNTYSPEQLGLSLIHISEPTRLLSISY